MYAVTGATGQLGRKVIKSLLNRVPASDVAALVRNPAKADDLGVQARAADYLDPSSLDDAFEDFDALLLISSNSIETRLKEHLNVVAAAKRAGVKRFIYTSLLHADDWNHWFAADHCQTEAWIQKQDLDFTILRNGWYWENHTVAVAPSLPYGGMIGSAGTGLISWASRQDFADAAAIAMTSEGHEGKIYELAGDRPYRLSDLAAEVARQTGKPFTYNDLTQAEHAEALLSAGLPPKFANVISEIEAQDVSTGVLHDDGKQLSKLLGRPTTSISDAVSAALMPATA
jgi:NAD(P)H dehydrogenase (quinone)